MIVLVEDGVTVVATLLKSFPGGFCSVLILDVDGFVQGRLPNLAFGCSTCTIR